MLINIKTVTGSQDFQLDIAPFYTSLDVKKQIEFLYAIPSTNQFLISNSALLSDDDLISNHLLLEEGNSVNNTLYLNDSTMKLSQPIAVESLTGMTAKFNVEPYYTIGDLKLLVHIHMHISSCQQRIIFAGKQLEDGKTVKECNIQPNDTVRLILRLAGS